MTMMTPIKFKGT